MTPSTLKGLAHVFVRSASIYLTYTWQQRGTSRKDLVVTKYLRSWNHFKYGMGEWSGLGRKQHSDCHWLFRWQWLTLSLRCPCSRPLESWGHLGHPWSKGCYSQKGIWVTWSEILQEPVIIKSGPGPTQFPFFLSSYVTPCSYPCSSHCHLTRCDAVESVPTRTKPAQVPCPGTSQTESSITFCFFYAAYLRYFITATRSW